MLLDKKYRLHEVMDADGAAVIDSARCMLVGTNGKALAAVPVFECPLSDAGELPAAAIAEAVKGNSKKQPQATIDVSESVVVGEAPRTVTFARPDDSAQRPPNDWPDLVNGARSLLIHLDAELLHKLAKAIGEKIVTLRFTPNENGEVLTPIIVVSPQHPNNRAVGVIMPMTIDKDHART